MSEWDDLGSSAGPDVMDQMVRGMWQQNMQVAAGMPSPR